jgi:hypothetical protein
MPHVTAQRRRARLIDHAAPPTPEEWLEHDARYFEDITAEIRRRAAGGDPADAPWTSPLYFDTAARAGSAVGRALLALRHLPGEAVARLVVLGRLFHGENVRPEATAGAERPADTEGETGLPGRARRKEGAANASVLGGRTVVTAPASAEALAG